MVTINGPNVGSPFVRVTPTGELATTATLSGSVITAESDVGPIDGVSPVSGTLVAGDFGGSLFPLRIIGGSQLLATGSVIVTNTVATTTGNVTGKVFAQFTNTTSGTISNIITPTVGSNLQIQAYSLSSDTVAKAELFFSGANNSLAFHEMDTNTSVTFNLQGGEPSGTVNNPIAIRQDAAGSIHATIYARNVS